MYLTYIIGRNSIVERPSHSFIFSLTLPDGRDGGNYEALDELLDKKPPEGCVVRYLGNNYPLVVVQSGLYDHVFEIVIDTEDCQELRLGTNLAIRKEYRGEFTGAGVTWVMKDWYGRRLRTGAPVRWRREEGWYNR